jgi:hypothetical protein
MQGRVAKSGPALWVVGPPARSAGSHGCQKRQISHGLVGRQAGHGSDEERARFLFSLSYAFRTHGGGRARTPTRAEQLARIHESGRKKKKDPGWQYFAAARSPIHPPAQQSPTSTGAELEMVLTHATVH